MTSLNLTRAEARARAALVKVQHYDISLDLSEGESTFSSITVVRFHSGAGSTFIDLRAAKVSEVLLDGRDITPTVYSPEAGLPLDLTEGEHSLRIIATCECTLLSPMSGATNRRCNIMSDWNF